MYVYCYTRCSQPCSRPPVIHASARDSWTLPGKSGSVSCKISAPLSWVLVHTRFCLCHISQSCVSSSSSMVGLMATSSERAYAIPKSAAPRVPAPAAVYCWPIPPQETFRHSSISVLWHSGGKAHTSHCVLGGGPEPITRGALSDRPRFSRRLGISAVIQVQIRCNECYKKCFTALTCRISALGK